MREARQIQLLFDRLMRQTPKPFPKLKAKLAAPEQPGVYVIYDPAGEVDHVGESTSIKGRLRGHMGNASSYVNKSLGRMGSQLRDKGYKFRCLAVERPRERMLLQSLTTGLLCPRHIGDRVSVSTKKIRTR